MRMFAGPNGSGKSTLKSVLPAKLLGIYLNPDEIEREIRKTGSLDLTEVGIATTGADVTRFYASSELMRRRGGLGAAEMPVLDGGLLRFLSPTFDSYLASATVDFLRQRLLASGACFTFETVMSHPGKVQLLADAKAMGYRTYLYYIATDDPEINVARCELS